MRNKILTASVLIFLFFPLKDFAQTLKITGVVYDSTSSKIIEGAVVKVKETGTITVTDSTGKFILTYHSDSLKTLIISCIGYLPKSFKITKSGNQKFYLSAIAKEIGEVLVTGYTQQSRTKTAGAISSIKGAELENVPVASFDVMLQGRIPGLYVGTPTGQPGEAGRITLRGMGSINGDVQPLYIVDGIQVSNTSFSGLNPDDFESVVVLKDAASTAQYGSRGANGVIMITTNTAKKEKMPENGKIKVDLKTYYGVSEVNSSKWDQMNTTHRLQFEQMIQDPTLPGWAYSPNNPFKLVNGVQVPKTPDDYTYGNTVLDSLRKINTDWRKYLLRTGLTQSDAISLSGNTENTSFYIAMSYLNQQGIALNSGIERYSIRTNVQNISGRLKSNLSIGLVQSDISFIQNEGTAPAGGSSAGGGGLSASNPIAALYFALPYEKPDPNNTGPNNFGSDALNEYEHSSLKDLQTKALISLNETFRINNEFQLNATAGMEYQQDKVTDYLDPDSYFGQLVSNGNQGMYQDSLTTRYRFLANTGARYLKHWNTNNEIEANVLLEMNRSYGTYFGYTGYGLTSVLGNTPAAITQGTASNNFIPVVAGSTIADNLLLSQIALLRYSYSNRYTLTASLRRDATSQAPSSGQNIYLWALGGKWNVKREPFMRNIDLFSNLQIRGSYGITANAGGFSSDFGFRQLYMTGNYNGNTSLIPQTPGNPNYTWEMNRISDLGIEFGLLKNRINGEIDLYNRVTDNLFVNENLSLTSGWPSVAANEGKVRNRGIEIEMNGDIIKKKAFKLNMGFNLAYNQNTVLNLGGQNMQFIDQISINQVGLPLGTFYAVRWKGVDPQTGAPVYLDKSGNSTTTYDASNAVPLKAVWDPPIKGGVNLSATYKNFGCSILISFIHGMSRLSYPYLYSHSADPNYRIFNQSADMLSIWQKPGDISSFQGASYTRQVNSSDVRSSDYIKIRNISLNYTVPLSPSASRYIHKFKIFIEGQNLFTFMKWKGFDPEDANDIAQYEYPMPRTVTTGLNITL